MTARQQHDFTK